MTASPDSARVPAARQPWLKARHGEDETARLDRLMHSCWRCGHRRHDLAALAEHEDGCRGAPRVTAMTLDSALEHQPAICDKAGGGGDVGGQRAVGHIR